MNQVKSLTSEELFFLGRQMKGPYIDYGYIAAMDDIQKSFAVHEMDNLSSLQDKGLVTEDFLGNVEPTEKAQIYRPIFFAPEEGRLEICGPAGETKLMDLRFHIMEDSIIMTSMVKNNIQIWSFNAEELSSILDAVLNLPKDCEGLMEEEVTLQDAFKVYVVSYGSVDGTSSRNIWFEKDDRLFKMESDCKVCQVASQQVIKSIADLYTGEVKT